MDKLLYDVHVRMEVEHFSDSSVNCYLHAIKQLCLFTGKLPDQMVEEDIYTYLLHLKNDKHLSRESIRNHLQGIRFVFRKLYKRIDIIQDIPYPKHTKKLPVILSSKELKLLFSSAHSLKHRMVLKIAYSGGLRRNEISRLKLVDIDTKNFLVRIENSKGNKDRYTLLAKSLIPELREYCRKYKPQKYLFNGKYKCFPYSEEGLRWTFDQALQKSGIHKQVSLHSLRHAFASHLLAMGTDLFTIQKQMGHDDIRTTMVYLQVNHQLRKAKLVSPLDLICQ
jgi:site-specific recombinase XerD